MGYNMKRGNSGVKFSELGSSPAKQDDEFLKEQREEAVKSTDYLTTIPNPTTKAVHRDLEEESPTEIEMQNKGDFNISNLHKDTKASLEKKKQK